MRSPRPHPAVRPPRVTAAAAILLTGALWACGESASEPRIPTTVTVTPASLRLTSLSETSALNATVLDQNGNTMADAQISWGSVDPGVAEVSAAGVVTARGEGSTTVDASIENASTSVPVTVEQVPDSVELTPPRLVMGGEGADSVVVAAVLDALGSQIDGATLSWSSHDVGVVTVADGLVTAVSDGSTSIVVEGSYGGTTVMGTLDVLVNPTLAVVTTALADAVEGLAYRSGALEAFGGDGTYAWSLAPGSDPLPTGLSMNASGVLSGTPGETGLNTFTVDVASGDGQVASGDVSIEVIPQPVLAPDALCSENPDYARVTFEDAALAGYVVVDRLALSGPEQLTCSLAASVLTLRPNNLGITSLVGLQNFPNLTRLEFADNDVSDVSPLQDLTKLEAILAWRNQLDDLTPISGLTALKTLWAWDNSIVDVTPLAAMTAMEQLLIDRNLIGDLSPLSGLTNLRTLSLDAVGIDDSDMAVIAGFTQLQTLSISGNGITDIAVVAGLPALAQFSARNNQIASLAPLADHPSLTKLFVSDNLVSDLTPLAGLTRLTSLDVRDNAVSDISAVSGMVDLAYLSVAENVVSDITAVAGLTELETLDLGMNVVTDIGPLAGLVKLRNLHLEENLVTSISSLADLVAVEWLTLRGNQISAIDELSSLAALRRLYLGSNQVTDISPVAGLEMLELVALSQNAGLSDIGPLIANPGLGAGDRVELLQTSVSCADVATLEAKGVTVVSAC